MKVSALIDVETRVWNMEVINNMFAANVCTKILAIRF